MAAQMKPESEPGTALARQKPTLPAEIQAKIEERRARNAVIAAIRGTQWGRDVSEQTVRAVADYADRNGIDAATELEILGGRIYKTAAYYRRKGAELIAAGVIRDIDYDHIGDDPRLAAAAAEAEKLAEQAAADGDEADAAFWRAQAREAKRESHRRRMARIKHAAPEKAAAVCVTRIHVASMAAPIEGVNWCGNGVRQRDPVGDAEPTKTSETRSERRAWIRLVTGELPVLQRAHPALAAFAQSETAGETGDVNDAIRVEAEQIATSRRSALPRAVATTGHDGYDEPTILEEPAKPKRTTTYRAPAPGRIADALTQTHVENAKRWANTPDPYGDEISDDDLLDLDAKRAEADELAEER